MPEFYMIFGRKILHDFWPNFFGRGASGAPCPPVSYAYGRGSSFYFPSLESQTPISVLFLLPFPPFHTTPSLTVPPLLP